MHLLTKNGCYLRREDDAALLLGFESGATISYSLITSPYLSLTSGNMSSLYIYTYIIESHYSCDVKVPLYRIVSVDGQHGKSVTKLFDRPKCFPVCRQILNTIEINIKDDADDSSSF